VGVPVRFVGAPTRPLGRDWVCPAVRRGGGITLPLGVGPAVRERPVTNGEEVVRRDPTRPEGRIPPGDAPAAVATGVTVRRRGLTAGVASGTVRPR
jgi:hypothetical protein